MSAVCGAVNTQDSTSVSLIRDFIFLSWNIVAEAGEREAPGSQAHLPATTLLHVNQEESQPHIPVSTQHSLISDIQIVNKSLHAAVSVEMSWLRKTSKKSCRLYTNSGFFRAAMAQLLEVFARFVH